MKKKSAEKTFPLWAKILVRVLVPLLCLAALAICGYFAKLKYSLVSVEKKYALVSSKLSECAELTSTKYQYSDIIIIRKKNMIAKSHSIVRYSGVIRIGIPDISMADVYLRDEGKTVEIVLPGAEILGNDIVDQEVYDESLSVFIPITTQEVFSEIETSRQMTAEKLVDEGILEQAQERARSVLEDLFTLAGFEKVVVR